MAKKITKEQFIERAKKIHGDKYDYSKVEYINSYTKVCIICLEHGEFWQVPKDHLLGKGCRICNGTKKLTTKQFIEKAKSVHGNKYDYSKVTYVNRNTKVCIICSKHGEFWQYPHLHLKGNICQKCCYDEISLRKKKTLSDFIKKSKMVHGDKYDYSRSEYKGTHTKICIICPKHGEFWQEPDAHIHNQGCPKCWEEKRKSVNLKDVKDFIAESNKIHGDKYDYSKVDYLGNKTKVLIICPIHGEFWQTPNMHLRGNGCPECGKIESSKHKLLDKKEFVKRAKIVHGDKYDYSKVSYEGAHYKVCIICPKHGEFWQEPSNHINGAGCPKCKESKLELAIRQFLDTRNIEYVFQFRDKKILKNQVIDFYLPQYNIAIECQGIQHFEPIDFSGNGIKKAEKLLSENKIRDAKKIRSCKENGIKLLHFLTLEKYFGTYENEIHRIEELEKVLIT